MILWPNAIIIIDNVHFFSLSCPDLLDQKVLFLGKIVNLCGISSGRLYSRGETVKKIIVSTILLYKALEYVDVFVNNKFEPNSELN